MPPSPPISTLTPPSKVPTGMPSSFHFLQFRSLPPATQPCCSRPSFHCTTIHQSTRPSPSPFPRPAGHKKDSPYLVIGSNELDSPSLPTKESVAAAARVGGAHHMSSPGCDGRPATLGRPRLSALFAGLVRNRARAYSG
jgi:hypothetical protein